jgi:cobalt-zinc-cadmium efflux system protein
MAELGAGRSNGAEGPAGHHGHDHANSHGHAHGHDHAHGDTHSRAFAIGIGLNLAIVAAEVLYGVAGHSMALLSDAAHNASDVLGLALAWAASLVARRKPSARHTYGLRRMTILAALGNAVFLLVGTGGVGWEAIRRLAAPGAVDARLVMLVAGGAAVVNAASAMLFMKGRHGDLNLESAFLHLAGDAAIAAGVVLSGLLVWKTGWTLADPLTSLVVSGLVLLSTWSLLKASLNLALDAVPAGIDVDEVRAFLAELPGVSEIHDLHIWAMSTTENALTAHLVMPDSHGKAAFLGDVCKTLHERFHIEHSTLQVEPPDAPSPCRLAPEETL